MRPTPLLPPDPPLSDGVMTLRVPDADRDTESIARFEEDFERRYPSTTSESTALVDQICAATRAENRAAALGADALFVGFEPAARPAAPCHPGSAARATSSCP